MGRRSPWGQAKVLTPLPECASHPVYQLAYLRFAGLRAAQPRFQRSCKGRHTGRLKTLLELILRCAASTTASGLSPMQVGRTAR